MAPPRPVASTRVKVLGLTGGIGAGKSTVAGLLTERGAPVIDADAVTRDLQRPGQPVYSAIVDHFGAGVTAPDGSLDRRALAEVVFADPAALAELEALTHPEVAAAIAGRLAAAAGGADEVMVLDVPLLFETGNYRVDGVVVVDCPTEIAVRRLVEGRGMAEGDVRARMARQATREERLAGADFVIDNGGPPERLASEVERAWTWIQGLESTA